MPRIFISYRRSDTRAIAGRLHDRLEMAFGDENIFKDVDDITPGADFRDVLRAALSECDVLLVLIGKNWTQGRLFDENDFVRFEVATALRRDDMTVIPVLLDGAQMPTPDELPDDMRSLAYRNAVVVRHDPDFRRDVDRLIDQLKKLVTGQISGVRAAHSEVTSRSGFAVGETGSRAEFSSGVKLGDGVAISGLMVGGLLAVIIVIGVLLFTLVINTDDPSLSQIELASTDVANGAAPFGWELGKTLYVTETTAVSESPGSEPYEPHTVEAGETVTVIEHGDPGGTIAWVILDDEVWFYVLYEDISGNFTGWLPSKVLDIEYHE